MVVVSVTRLRVRSLCFLLPFIWYAGRSTLQAKRSPGNIGVRLRHTKRFAFWTLSLWGSNSAMGAFRIAPPHRDAMRKLPYWCNEASYAQWKQNDLAMTSWHEAVENCARAV